MGLKYVFKTKPRGYQVRALKKVVGRRGGGLLMPMRSGKTKVAVDWACVMKLKYGCRRVLVVTHSPTTFGVWKDEFRKHCALPYTIWVKGEPDPCPDGLEVMVLNVQNVYDRKPQGKGWEPDRKKMLYRWKPEMVIVDEATTLGDPMAVQSRHLYRLQNTFHPYKLVLTGTPIHRGPLKSFGMWKFLDESIFGSSVVAFRMKYGQWGGWGNKKLIRYVNLKDFRRKIEPWVYQLVRVPLRPPIHQVIPVDLTFQERTAYNRMVGDSVFTTETGQQIAAPIILTRLLKEAQLAAGWIRDEDKKWHHIGTSQRDAFADLVGQLRESRVNRLVIYARHIPELKDAMRVLKAQGYEVLALHGGVPATQREQRIASFHEPGGRKAFVSQISTGSMGIDLSCADTIIYYTLTESLLHKDQADARIRVHNDKRALTYYYLIPKDTILETMYLSLQSKMNLVDFVMKHPDLIHRQERG